MEEIGGELEAHRSLYDGVCMTSKCGRRRWTVCSVLTWSEVNILGLSNLRELLTNI